MIRLILIMCLFLLPVTVSAQESAFEIPLKTVITAEEIRSAGITRLHDLFTLFDNWTGYTVNGQDWQTAAYGLSVYKDPGWVVMIDYHLISLSAAGLTSFNLLPVSLQEIEKVIVIDSPQLYKGHFADRGLIHIITDNEQAGWKKELRFSVGNEINDPGPYEFTDLNSPNEERLGPDADAVLGYRSDNWHLQGSGSVMRHRSTDTPVERRVMNMLYSGTEYEDPTNLKIAGHLIGSYSTESVDINIQGGSTRQRDFLFFKPFGREIPVQFLNSYAGLNAVYKSAGRHFVNLNSTINRQKPAFSPNRNDFDFNFRQTDQQHGLEIQWIYPNRELSSGIRFEQTKAAGSFDETPDPVRRWTFYQQWKEKLTDNAGIISDLRIATDGGGSALSLGVRAVWNITANQTIKPYLSFSERLASQSQDLWLWVGRGYNGLNPLDIEYANLPERITSSLTSAGIIWEITPSENFGIKLNGYTHLHNGYFLSRKQYHMVQPQQWFNHEGIDFFPDERVSLTGLNINIRLQSFESLSHTFFYGTRHIISGTEPLKHAFSEIPANRTSITTSFKPVEGFELWAGLQIQSSVTWHEFDRVDGESYTDFRQLDKGIYRRTTGPIFHMDLGGRKSLWQGRLWLNLYVKDLFNQPYFHYPVGVDQDLTFYVQLEMRL